MNEHQQYRFYLISKDSCKKFNPIGSQFVKLLTSFLKVSYLSISNNNPLETVQLLQLFYLK